MLTLEALTLRQGDFTLHADWTLAPGARLALIGPSGAGKSTVLASIAGFLDPEAGRILWEGRDLRGTPPGKRPVAMLFQDGNLFPHLTVARNVGLGIRPDLKLTAADRDRVSAALTRVGLAGMEDRMPGSLSGGQQSRVALARVLVMDRPLLLLDEPFAALGPALRAEMLELVSALCDDTGATLVMVSHAPEDAQRITGLTCVVADGQAAPPVDTAAVFADPPQVLRDYLG
ncbi:thiamine ABC transporter ATP-binding protein [Pseudooceanicola onchidii]|uniref:thiamine ABC transporter ATP-binding protein n=1 Tax=Pseudooceanicola onchidii TaxID=2562279 RepID=UPI0010AADB88|nr:thiamine ABC transporter ATP-binding protein [Pseudooceanicola onchidii]